jgi:hypothetical protein
MQSNIELSQKRIEDGRKTLAKCLGMLETASQDIKWACEAERWNDEVAFQIDEAALKLGFALAALSRWNDEPDEEE